MIATSLLYPPASFELAGINKRGFVVVRVNVCFVSASKNGEQYLEQSYAVKLCVKQREGVTYTYQKFRKHLLIILYHVLKYFGSTKIVNWRETVEDESRAGRLASLRRSAQIR
jgi:hypothetical protein